jgi:hypothetical protein
VGLCSISLRPLGVYLKQLGLDPRTDRSAARLCTSSRRLHWRSAIQSFRFDWRRRWRQRGMVPIGSEGSLCADVSDQPHVCGSRQRQQYDREQRHDHKRLQQHQQYEYPILEQERERRRDCRNPKHFCECTTGGTIYRCCEPAGDQVGSNQPESGSGSNTKQCAWIFCRQRWWWQPCGSADCSRCQSRSCGENGASSSARSV